MILKSNAIGRASRPYLQCVCSFQLHRPPLNTLAIASVSKYRHPTYSLPCSRFMAATTPRCCGLATHAITPADDNYGFFSKLMKKFGWADNSRSRLRVSSYIMYQSVADTIDYKGFFQQFNLPNTFNSWFLVTELHVWMLLVRAMAEGDESGEDGRFIRNCIVEALWADVNTRAKKLGSQNPSGVRTQIQILSQQFQAALITYDEGIMADDKALAGALWRRFFEMDCDNYEKLEEMVLYVRQQVKLLDALNRYDFAVKPKIKWTNPTAVQ